MKTQSKILVAFILNLAFSIFEFIGGAITGSVAIVSDAIHDVGDAMSIGISYFLEKKSKKQPDDLYTYGYARYSVIGSMITTLILLFGSVAVIYNAAKRFIHPAETDYNGMIVFAVVGVTVNFCAALFTRDGESLNQKAVNLHMLEDVLGWAVVFIGAIVMKFTGFAFIDPIISLGVSVFILLKSAENLKETLFLLLEKTPQGTDINEIKEHIAKLDGIISVHHVHIWSLDGINNYATMHIVTNADAAIIKQRVREELLEHGICHATLELETDMELCSETHCKVNLTADKKHCHRH